MAIDLYSVLAVPRNATTVQIRDSFRRLARGRHPDLYQGDEKQEAETAFQSITEAFNVLSHPERRRVYDQELREAVAPRVSAQRQTAVAYVKRGVEAYRAGNLVAAEKDLERATVEDPEFARAWYLLARAKGQRIQGGTAVQAAVRACELDPTVPQYLELAAEYHAAAGKTEDAKSYYRRALSWGADENEVSQALAELDGKRRVRK